MLMLHLLILYLSAVAPVWGYYFYKNFKRDCRIDPGKRMLYYRRTVIELWGLAAVYAGYVQWQGISWHLLGFAGAEWGRVSVLLVAGLLSFIAAPLVMMAWIPGYRDTMHQQLQSMDDFLPGTRREKIVWVFISITAGVCEELLFRSLMFYYFPLLFPGISIIGVVMISSLLFGLGHCYQGVKGVLSATLMGGFFGCLYYFTGSIWLCMLFHTLIDARIILMLPANPPSETAL